MTEDLDHTNSQTKYHPCDTPRGMKYYQLDELTDDQQKQLNDLKIQTIREDEKYLAAHPEIRAIVSIIFKEVFRRRPVLRIHEFIAKFFNRSEHDIRDDIEHYLSKRKDHVYEDTTAMEISKRYQPPEKINSMEKPSDYRCFEECVCPKAEADRFQPYSQYDERTESNSQMWLRTIETIEKPKISVTRSEPEAFYRKLKLDKKETITPNPPPSEATSETFEKETALQIAKSKVSSTTTVNRISEQVNIDYDTNTADQPKEETKYDKASVKSLTSKIASDIEVDSSKLPIAENEPLFNFEDNILEEEDEDVVEEESESTKARLANLVQDVFKSGKK